MDRPLVCITGAAGYIGTFVVQALRARGYPVRATVRDLGRHDKVAPLEALGAEVVAADLMTPGAFDAAVKGAHFVVHTATAVLSKADDPQRAIVDPAVQGTLHLLESARRAGTVKRVVITSSAASIIDGARPPDGHTFTEADWNESATVQTAPYDYAKREAERAATRFVAALPEAERFELCALHPTMVFGPVAAEHHLSTTPGIIRDLLEGAYPAAPDLTFGIIDVRDVAEAHVRALEVQELLPRYICYAESLSIPEIARLVRELEPRGRAPRLKMPNFAMYGVALFDARLTWSFLRRNLGRRRRIDNRRLRTDLGVEPRSAAEAVEATVRSLVQQGWVELKG